MATVSEEVSVQVRFTVVDDDGLSFTDALYFTPDEHKATAREDIDAAQMARHAAWKEAVANPPVEVPVAPEVELVDVGRELERLNARKGELLEAIRVGPGRGLR